MIYSSKVVIRTYSKSIVTLIHNNGLENYADAPSSSTSRQFILGTRAELPSNYFSFSTCFVSFHAYASDFGGIRGGHNSCHGRIGGRGVSVLIRLGTGPVERGKNAG